MVECVDVDSELMQDGQNTLKIFGLIAMYIYVNLSPKKGKCCLKLEIFRPRPQNGQKMENPPSIPKCSTTLGDI